MHKKGCSELDFEEMNEPCGSIIRMTARGSAPLERGITNLLKGEVSTWTIFPPRATCANWLVGMVNRFKNHDTENALNFCGEWCLLPEEEAFYLFHCFLRIRISRYFLDFENVKFVKWSRVVTPFLRAFFLTRARSLRGTLSPSPSPRITKRARAFMLSRGKLISKKACLDDLGWFWVKLFF